MRKHFWIVVCFTLLALTLAVGACRAEVSLSDTLDKVPVLKQGVAYSALDNKLSYLSTLELASWKGFTVEAGYSSSDKLVGVISYPLVKLKNYISLPILDLLECNLGLYAGYSRIAIKGIEGNNEFDYGFSATLISVKF